MSTTSVPSRELAIAGWAMLGVVALLVQAISRLTPLAIEPILDRSLTPLQATVYVGWVAVNAYAEGYRGFHKAWAPRVVVRTWHVARQHRPLHVVLAPVIAMGLWHANRRRLLSSWLLLIAIALLVLAMRFLAQPYRGIIDGGVVVGLGIGLASLLLHFVRSLGGSLPLVDADFPAPRG